MNLLASVALIAIIVIVVLILIVVVAISGWYVSTYNTFKRLFASTEEAFSTMDVYLKKRYDLIPNLVETVKAYAKHESETLTSVISARNQAVNASTNSEKIEANAQLNNAIRSFNMVAERYPQLKADAQFVSLQNSLRSIENEIVNARKYHNATVKAFNTKRELFPAVIVANNMGLEKLAYFEITNDVERDGVKVSF